MTPRVLFLASCALMALASLSPLPAAPAFPGTFQLEQPDGTKITARARGDEEFHWYEDEQGRPIEQNAAGEWVYLSEKTNAAALRGLRTKRVVGRHQPPARPWRPVRPHRPKRIPVRSVPLPMDQQAKEAAPVKGAAGRTPRKPPLDTNTEARIATICARYGDRLNQSVYATSVFEEMLFGTTTTKATMRDLYRDMSFGSFDVTGGPEGVTGWYDLPQSRAFYGGNANKDSKDTNMLQLLYDLLDRANPDFDFGPYDTDNDGYVDCLGVILQGVGEEAGGGKEAVWSHQFSISELRGMEYSTGAWATGDVNSLGNPVYVDTYMAMPERQKIEGGTISSTMGVYAHEYGHALGLPDLYDNDGGSQGLGNWSLMAGGSWNAKVIGGDCPAWMDAWCRAKLGFTTVENITYNHQNFKIREAKEENKVYRLWREGAAGPQYFLMENRQRSGFDQCLPGAGLLIYHIDETVTTGNSRPWYMTAEGNLTRQGHYLVALEQADGRFNLELTGKDSADQPRGNGGDAGDPFASGVNFDETGFPNSAAYNIPPAAGQGVGTYVAVRNVSAPGTTMTADLFVQVDKGFPTVEITFPASDGIALEHVTSFEGTAYDAFGLDEVRVALLETKPGGRWWDWISNGWGSTTFDYGRHVKDASGTTSWTKSFNDAAFSDGGYRLAVSAIDTSGAASEFVYRDFRIQRDMSLPSVTIESPAAGVEYAVIPSAGGTATDNVAVQSIRTSLFSEALGRWYNWSTSSFDAATFNFASHVQSVTPSGNTWSAPLPADLPHGGFQLYVQSVDTTDQASDWVPRAFSMQRAPVVRILGPAANAATNTFAEIHGTVHDTGGVGIEANQVSLTLSRNGQFWNGSVWVAAATSVTASLAGDGSWSYGSLPTDDGLYSIAASVVDTSGVSSTPTQGVNQNFFHLDMTPPEVAIATPIEGSTITEAPLVAPFMSGSASDNLGVPAVTLYLKRLEDDAYWSGKDWIYNANLADLTTAFPGLDGGSREDWEYTGRLPRLGCMPNGSYEVIAIARDSVGNEQQASSFFVLDYQPVWLRAEDEAARLLPPQSPPIAAGSVATTDLGEITSLRKPSDDTRRVNPSRLHFDAAGHPYVVSHSIEEMGVMGGPPGGISFQHGVLLRHGAGGWRREREVNFDPGLSTWSERWEGSGAYQAIASWDARRDGGITTAFDEAGNCLMAFSALQQETDYWNDGGIVRSFSGWGASPRIVVAKFDSNGTLLWRSLLPPGSDTTGWLEDSGVIDIKPLSNGGAALLIQNYYDSSPYYSFHRTPRTVVATVGTASDYIRFFGDPGFGEDDAFESSPEFLAVDSSNHVFAVSHELGDQVIRRLEPAGNVTAEYATSYCETPQSIHGLTTDADGNLYVASSFTVAGNDTRACVSKFSSSLALQWRAYAPANSAMTWGNVELNVTASGITLVSQAAADPTAIYPYEHPVFSRFSLDGHLLWSRGFQSGHAAAQFGDMLSEAEFCADGSILFTASLGPNGGLHYGKLSTAGDLQFLKPIPSGVLDTALLPDGRLGLLMQDGVYPNEEPFRILALANPASVVLPPVFDPQPQDVIASTGDPIQLVAVDRGSAATYQWQKMDGGGAFQDVAGETTATLAIASPTVADGGSYRLVATNSAGTIHSRTVLVQVRSSVPLGDAVEQPALTWTTGGDAPWQGIAPQPSFDGEDAAESGVLGGTGSSWVSTTIEGPTTVRFRWKVSSVGGFNTLTLWVDGSQVDVISGEVDWTENQVTLGAGSHTMEWRYTKTINFNEGSDRAWLDDITTGGSSGAPVFHPDFPEDREVALGEQTQLQSLNLGGPAAYQWYKLDAEGVPVELAGATDPFHTIGSFQASDIGRYMVIATNASGTTGSRIAELSLPTVSLSLEDALDDPGRTWITGGTSAARWKGLVVETAQDGTDLAHAGPAANSSETWLETTVQGPGTATFWWRTSSEGGFDFLTFTLDGGNPQGISGATSWAQVTVPIPAGSHLLRWTYAKDESVSSGEDRGYVDSFAFTPNGGFSSWLAGQGFSESELQDPAITGPDADPDGDGIATLIEYAFGLAARVPNNLAGLVEPVHTPGSFSLRFTRVKGTSGIHVAAQAWDGAAGTDWSDEGITLTWESETPATETWRATIATGAKGFLRVHVTETP